MRDHRYRSWVGAIAAACVLATMAKSAEAGLDPHCRPVPPPLFFNHSIADQRDPVVIVGGTMAAELLYGILKARLQGDHYHVYFYELLAEGRIDLNINAASLGLCVREVLSLHPQRKKVDLIGHSQGSMVSRAYIHLHGGASSVDSMVSLAGPHRGTDPENIIVEAIQRASCTDSNHHMRPLCVQMRSCKDTEAERRPRGTPCLLDQVGNPDEPTTFPTPDPVFYTNVVTVRDDVVCPIHSGLMTGPSAQLGCPATPQDTARFIREFLAADPCPARDAPGMSNACNVVLEADCPLRPLLPITHLSLANDGAVYGAVRDALEHIRGRKLNCLAP